MLKKCGLSLMLLLLANIAFALEFRAGRWNNISVELNQKPAILSIFIFNNHKVEGNYFYKNTNLKIPVTGSVEGTTIVLTDIKKNRLSIATTNSANKHVYQFTSTYVGEFYDCEINTAFPTTYLLYNTSVGNYEKRYSEMETSDENVESYATQVKNAILNGDKTWLADHCYYNLLAQTAIGEFSTIRTKAQFLENYAKIISDILIADLALAHTLNINTNNFGAIEIGVPTKLPNITIDEFLDEKTNKRRLLITSISYN